MADDKTINTTSTAASQAIADAQKQQQQLPKKTGADLGLGRGEEMGQQEFLTLLVNQLQHQDPLNPMDSQEFSVQLAQFSQLEQLIGIKQTLEGDTATSQVNSMSSMASFLGHEVTLGDQNVNISKGRGPNLSVDLPPGTQGARVDLIGDDGRVKANIEMDDLNPGKQSLSLDNVAVADGAYGVRVVAVNEAGQFIEVQSKVTGTVEGFVMEPEPALLVNGTEIALDQVVEVALANKPKD